MGVSGTGPAQLEQQGGAAQALKLSQETDRYDKQLATLEATLAKKLPMPCSGRTHEHDDDLRRELREMVEARPHEQDRSPIPGPDAGRDRRSTDRRRRRSRLDELLASLPASSNEVQAVSVGCSLPEPDDLVAAARRAVAPVHSTSRDLDELRRVCWARTGPPG